MADAVNGTSAPISQTDGDLSRQPSPEELAATRARLDIVDKLHELGEFLECVYLAAEHAQPDAYNTFLTVLGHVMNEMRELAQEIHPEEEEEEEEEEESEA